MRQPLTTATNLDQIYNYAQMTSNALQAEARQHLEVPELPQSNDQVIEENKIVADTQRIITQVIINPI